MVVLDYNLRKTTWEPAPPESVPAFYDAFLEWRAQAGMDNEMADHLEAMSRGAWPARGALHAAARARAPR